MNFFQTKLKPNQEEKNVDVPLKAGLQLLSRFQEDWAQIHQNSVLCSNKAKEMGHFLHKVFTEIKLAEENLNKFHFHLQTIPTMLKQADGIIAALEKLETTVTEVSCALDFYEKISHEHDVCNRRQAALREVNELRIAKREELEKTKEQLAKKHAQHLAQIKAQQESLAAERQKLLVDAICTSEGGL